MTGKWENLLTNRWK